MKCLQIILDHSLPTKVILWEGEHFQDITFPEQKATELLNYLANLYPDDILLWHDSSLTPYVKPISIVKLLSGPFDVLHCSGLFRYESQLATLGYVDFSSSFLLLKGNTRYPSWLVTSQIGVTYAALFQILKLRTDCGFMQSLLEWGYEGQKHGFCCYSEPILFSSGYHLYEEISKLSNVIQLNQVQLIKRIYGLKWVWFWVLAIILDKKQMNFLSLFRAIFSLTPKPFVFNQKLLEERINSYSLKNICEESNIKSVDVILPTLGRLDHLRNVLLDLSGQTVLPNRVVIIEQIPPDLTWPAISLDYEQEYPFEIVKKIVHWTGVCRARNLGLSICNSKWVLFLDDDIRFGDKFIEDLISGVNLYKVQAINECTYQLTQPIPNPEPMQIWHTFGGGVGLVERELAVKAGGFDEKIIGYGEDGEFGVRLRKVGSHILYTTNSPVLHLKAERGGFRFTKLPWFSEKIKPRPSPTVLYALLKHNTTQMNCGFQLFTFIKRIRSVCLLKWLPEYQLAKQQWLACIYWASWLAN